jgi:hypothetical protein
MPLSTTVTPPNATLNNPSCRTPIPDFMKPIRRIQSLTIRHSRLPTRISSLLQTERPTMSGTVYNYRHKARRYFAPITGQTNEAQCSTPESSIRHLTVGHTTHPERTVQSPPAPRPLLLSFQPVISGLTYSRIPTNDFVLVPTQMAGADVMTVCIVRQLHSEMSSHDTRLGQNVHNRAR